MNVLKNQRLRGISIVQARVGLAANCAVRCGRLRRTLKDGQADRRGNCRGVNRPDVRNAGGLDALKVLGKPADVLQDPDVRRLD